MRIAGAKRAMCCGLSSNTPFGATPTPSQTGAAEWHMEQRDSTMATTFSGAEGCPASSVASGSGASPSTGRMPGDEDIATQNAAQIAMAATSQAHQGALP